ncbi:MAG: AMP-binding protein [Anaerolineae bacterium]
MRSVAPLQSALTMLSGRAPMHHHTVQASSTGRWRSFAGPQDDTDGPSAMTEPQTLPQFWLDNVRRWPGNEQIAARQKDLGIWQSYSWTQEYEQVRDFSLGLVELGLQRGERVALIGDNDLEYLWGILAVLAAGGVVVGIFTDVTPQEVQYLATHSDATFALAGDQEQCDKLLAIQQATPLIRQVIYWDERGMWSYDEPQLMNFKAVQALGRAAHQRDPERFDALIAQGQPDDVAMFCYTSGTTGLPKGAMISHANFIYVAQAFDTIERVRASDNYLSFIPMAWIGGAALDLAPHCTSGVTLNFAEGPDTVQQNIREIAPDAILYNSRLWENLVASIQVRMTDASWVNRLLYKTFQPVGYRVAEFRLRRQQAPVHWRLLYGLGQVAFYRPVLSQYGLQRARTAYTAGAALSPDVVRFFLALGLPLRQIYGSTEVTGGAIAHRAGDIKFESIGVPLPDAAHDDLSRGGDPADQPWPLRGLSQGCRSDAGRAVPRFPGRGLVPHRRRGPDRRRRPSDLSRSG